MPVDSELEVNSDLSDSESALPVSEELELELGPAGTADTSEFRFLSSAAIVTVPVPVVELELLVVPAVVAWSGTEGGTSSMSVSGTSGALAPTVTPGPATGSVARPVFASESD